MSAAGRSDSPPSVVPATVPVKPAGPRKLTIKPLKTKPKLPENFEEETWAMLQAAVKAVHAKSSVGTSLEELYRAVEALCTHNLAESLYDRLQQQCERHIEACLDALQGQTPDTLAFLALVRACWDDHCEQMHILRSIFLYLDRTYVMQVSPRLRPRPPGRARWPPCPLHRSRR